MTTETATQQLLTEIHEIKLILLEVTRKIQTIESIVTEKYSLLTLLTSLEDIPDNFPDIDEGLLPLDNIVF